MTVKIPAHARQGKSGDVILLPVSRADSAVVARLFAKKSEWEARNGKEYVLQASLELNYGKRTFKQNAAVWKLVECIWLSMEKDPPAEEEKYALYLDLLEAYADKTKNRVTGGLRPVHISESNTIEGVRFIDGLLYHLSAACGLDYGTQSQVIDVLREGEEWRGGLETDPLDYADLECTRLLTEAEWREKRVVSEASGRGGDIVRAHIVSRGADRPDIEKAWNWVALLPEEHAEQHRLGWDKFLDIYPHLRGRVNRARNLAGKLELESRRASGRGTEALAKEALGEEEYRDTPELLGLE
jgi:hypothetical protein